MSSGGSAQHDRQEHDNGREETLRGNEWSTEERHTVASGRRRDNSVERQVEEGAGKQISGASIWSPHLFHRNHNKNEQHQHHYHHHLLNPLQYINHDYQRQNNMANSRHRLSITTTSSHSPPRDRSPISRSNSKANSPTSFVAPSQSSHLYNPPYLHWTHQQPVKETHLLDIDFDPISGRKSINRYEIIDEIGRGTHGKVKLGRDLVSGEYVAIKIVERNARPRLGKMVRQEDEKVRREIAILKKCRHPNVVKLIEVIDDPASKKVYLVLEYVELGEIAWRKLGARDVVRRERLRLKQELMGENVVEEDLAKEQEEEELRRWKRRKRKQLKQQMRQSTASSSKSPKSTNDENPNFWSLELGGLTEEDDEPIDGDYPSLDEDDEHGREVRPPVDAPHIPPLDSDSEEPALLMRSLSMMAMSRNPDAPPYSFSHEDLQYVPALTMEQARSSFRDTVLGLEYLHYHGIIHRDIKPANLLWTKDYRVKISDFGVSYLGKGASDDDDSEGGDKKFKRKDQISGRDEEIELAKTVGTPAFFAPELCFFDTSKPRPQITAAIDVWALGVTLYCLIFARCPFLADGEFELFNVIAKQELFIPKRRIRPAQIYSATAAHSRPSSSSRPRSIHQRSQSSASSKTAPVYSRPPSGPRGKCYSEEQETELIPDDLRDLLKRMLTKDPTKRITIKEVKHHPWILEGLPDPIRWVEETDPERMSGGGRIEVNQEEMEKAVVPASWGTAVIGRMRSSINKLRQKMGMGGSSDGGSGTKKEKVGLHPLASRGNSSVSRDGLHPHPSVLQRPGSSSSISTLQDQVGAMNKFSLSNIPTAPYSSSNLAPPTSASTLTRLLNSSSPGKPPPATTNVSVLSPKDSKASSSTQPMAVSPSSVKKFLNGSQTSLTNSLSRSLSRSSHNSVLSGPESTSPSKFCKEKRGRSMSFLRRSRSMMSGGASTSDDATVTGKVVRRATSSNLGHEITTGSPPNISRSASTVRRHTSTSVRDLPTKPRITLAPVPADEEVVSQPQSTLQSQQNSISPAAGSTPRSRRSSASSTSNNTSHGRESILSGLFGRGKRLVRSFSRSRDTLASESEAVMSASGGSGDEEKEKHKGLRISMLRRKKSHGVEAGPILSRVYARGNVGAIRSRESIISITPSTVGGDGYFDLPQPHSHERVLDMTPGSNRTASTIVPTQVTPFSNISTTTTTTQSSISPSTSDLPVQSQLSADRLKVPETSCPPSPDDFYEWEKQSQVRERQEVEREERAKMARQLEESLRREVSKGLHRNDVTSLKFPGGSSDGSSKQYWQSQSQSAQLQQSYVVDGDNLTASSSEEKMYMQHGHRHTGTTTSSSLTECNSFPSIQSMLESSAASSVSADAGWGISTLKAPGRPLTVNSSIPSTPGTCGNNIRDSGNYVVNSSRSSTTGTSALADATSKDARDSGFYVDDSQSVHSSHHHKPSTGSSQANFAPSTVDSPPPVSAYHSYIHSKSDEEDDGDDEALYMGLGSRRKSAQLGASGKDAATAAQGKAARPAVMQHKRAISSASSRSIRTEDRQSKDGARDGKEKARRRRSSRGADSTRSGTGSGGGRGRSRSNTASSALAPYVPSAEGTVGGGKRERERRGIERREKEDQEKESKILMVPEA